MTRSCNSTIQVFQEPNLEFAEGQCMDHPAVGLTLFGPVDSKGIEKPGRIEYAVIGVQDGIKAFNAFARRINHPIAPQKAKKTVFGRIFPVSRKLRTWFCLSQLRG
jgi:hypothetical protein